MNATEEREFVYGWGRTKHLPDTDAAKRYETSSLTRGLAVGLCGAGGGHTPEPRRPLCKKCARLAGQETPEQYTERLETALRTVLGLFERTQPEYRLSYMPSEFGEVAIESARRVLHAPAVLPVPEREQ